MNDDLQEFERKARAQLNRELDRVPVPRRTLRNTARPQRSATTQWRNVTLVAAVAGMLLLALIVASRIEPAPTAGTASVQSLPAAERIYVWSVGDFAASSELHPTTERISAINPASGKLIFNLKMPSPSGQHDGVVSPDGTIIYDVSIVGGNAASLIAYQPDAATRRWQRQLGSVINISDSGSPVLTIAPDGKRLYLLVQSRQKKYIRVFNSQTGVNVGTIDLPTDSAGSGFLSIAPDSRTLYYAMSTGVPGKGQVLVIDAESRQITRRIPIFPSLSATALSPDGRTLYVASEIDGRQINAVDLEQGTISGEIIFGSDPRTKLIGGVALSPDGTLLATAIHDGQGDTIRILDALTLREVRSIAVTDRPDQTLQAWGLTWSRDGRTVYGIVQPADLSEPIYSRVMAYNSADGSAREVLNVPGEMIARLLVGPEPPPAVAAQPTPIAPDRDSVPTPVAPPAEPDILMPPTPQPRSPYTFDPARNEPLAWVWLRGEATNEVLAIDALGRQEPLLSGEIADVTPRRNSTPLAVVRRDPEHYITTNMDGPNRSGVMVDVQAEERIVEFKNDYAFLSNTAGKGVRLFVPGDMSNSRTILDSTGLDDPTLLIDARLLGQNADSIYLWSQSSATTTVWRVDPSSPAPQPEILLTVGNGATIVADDQITMIAYVPFDSGELHLLNPQTGEDHTIDQGVLHSTLALSADGSRIFYLRKMAAVPTHYELVARQLIATPRHELGSGGVLADGLLPTVGSLHLTANDTRLVIRTNDLTDSANREQIIVFDALDLKALDKLYLPGTIEQIELNSADVLLAITRYADDSKHLLVHPLRAVYSDADDLNFELGNVSAGIVYEP